MGDSSPGGRPIVGRPWAAGPLWEVLIIVWLFSGLASGTEPAIALPARLSTIYECNFQRQHDTNADRQPDGWRRRRDRDHPGFIASQITPRDAALTQRGRDAQVFLARLDHAWRTGRWDPAYVPEVIPPLLVDLMDGVVMRDCYQVNMDGGAFELVSPHFPVDRRYSFQLQGEIACRELADHEALIELHLRDPDTGLTLYRTTPGMSGTQDWQWVQSEPLHMVGRQDAGAAWPNSTICGSFSCRA